MSDPEIVHLLQITIDAMDFQFMIGDVKDFLAFSEESIDWQHKRELRAPHSSPAADRCLTIQD